jgi:hypothetical protein
MSGSFSFLGSALYLVYMKQYLAAIAFNERELESYVAQLKSQRFETVSDVKKAEDGTFYQVMAKSVKQDFSIPLKATVPALETVAVFQ